MCYKIKEMCVKLVIYWSCTKMHSQQDIKKNKFCFLVYNGTCNSSEYTASKWQHKLPSHFTLLLSLTGTNLICNITVGVTIISQSQPPHTWPTNLLEAAIFDPRLRSSYSHDTRYWTYTDTKNCKFEISPFHIKNVHKIYKGKINYKKGPMDV